MFTHHKLIRFCIGLVCASVLSVSHAWNNTGHKVIARIAYQDLTPKTRQAVRKLIQAYQPFYPNSNTFEKASTWADEIRGSEIMAFNHWHYINKPYEKGTGYRIKSWEPQNVVWAIRQSERVLRSRTASDFEKAWFLRFYIHLVGDVHQPLHCVELYSSAFPGGDKGGNRYTIKSSIGDNLHQVWDRGVGYFNRYRGKDRFKKIAAKVREEYPRQRVNAEMKKQASPKTWANASYKIATTFAYQVPLDESLSREYRSQGKTYTKQQLALAGYRLADGLNAIFDPSSSS